MLSESFWFVLIIILLFSLSSTFAFLSINFFRLYKQITKVRNKLEELYNQIEKRQRK